MGEGLGANFAEGTIGRAMLHAGAGCISAVSGGGNCGRGALSAGATNYIGSQIGDLGGRVPNTIVHALIGGTASVLGGDKFANGAITGAFGYLFNGESHDKQKAAEARMDTELRALRGDPRFWVSQGEVRMMLQVEGSDGVRRWIEGKPDRLIIDLEKGSAHICECKGGDGKYTPPQRGYYGGTIVDIMPLSPIQIPNGTAYPAQLGGQSFRANGINIGQSGLFAEDGRRAFRSTITKAQFNSQGMKLITIKLRGIRGGAGGGAR